MDVLGRSGDTTETHDVVRGQVAGPLAPAARPGVVARMNAGAVLRVVDALHADGGGPSARGVEEGREEDREVEEGRGADGCGKVAGTKFPDKVRTQIGMFRPIRMDHTNCLQVAIKTLQFQYLKQGETMRRLDDWTT